MPARRKIGTSWPRPARLYDGYIFDLDGTIYLGPSGRGEPVAAAIVAMARAAGMPSALVLTGDTSVNALRAAPESERPDYVLERVDQLLPLLRRRE